MNTKMIPSKIQSESVLIGILRLIGLLCLYKDSDHVKRGRPYVYPTTVMLRCFVVRIWMRIPSNNALYYYFSINAKHTRKVMKSWYRHTKGQRLERYHFFKSRKGQKIIRKRGAIERLFDRTKDTYGIESLAVRGYLNVSSYVLACVFVYQIAIYYNCVTGRTRPQCIKHMLGS